MSALPMFATIQRPWMTVNASAPQAESIPEPSTDAKPSLWGTKNTKNTKKWWIAKTGWTDEEFRQHRKAVITKIRERWPEEKMLNGRDGNGHQVKQEVKQMLRPLVTSLNETNWPIGASNGPNRIERQLQCYTSWALFLNRTYMPSPEPEEGSITRAPSHSIPQADQSISLTTKPRPVPRAQNGDWSFSSDEAESPAGGLPEAKSEVQARRSNSKSVARHLEKQSIDWDDVEVMVDITSLGLDEVWLPMIDLKPKRDSPCHWADFDVSMLYKQLSKELDTKLKCHSYEFTFTNHSGDFHFYRQGAYRIMLKRFSQSTDSNILKLKIQRRLPFTPRSNSIRTPQSAMSFTSHTLARASIESQVATSYGRQVQNNGARQGFPNTIPDSYENGVEDSTRPAKRQKHVSATSETIRGDDDIPGSAIQMARVSSDRTEDSEFEPDSGPTQTTYDPGSGVTTTPSATQNSLPSRSAAEELMFSETESSSSEAVETAQGSVKVEEIT